MAGIQDKLGDLSWLGEPYANQGWVEVGEAAETPMTAEEANKTVEQLLKDTAWAVALDNMSMTKEMRAQWIDFRDALRNVSKQEGFPTSIVWPTQPE